MHTQDYGKFGSVDHSNPTCVGRPASDILGTRTMIKTKDISTNHVKPRYNNQVVFRSGLHGKGDMGAK